MTAKPLSVPLLVTTSPAAKPVGASLKVKLMVAVSPALSADLLLVMASVGARVSMAMVGVVPAPPLLPAASVYRLEATVMLALAVVPTVGVKVAV